MPRLLEPGWIVRVTEELLAKPILLVPVIMAVLMAIIGIAHLLDFVAPVLGIKRGSPRTLFIAVVVGIAVVAAGAVLYELRTSHRLLYAYLEIIVAAGGASESFVRLTSRGEYSTLTFAVLAATYIAVRGFDNMAVARQALAVRG